MIHAGVRAISAEVLKLKGTLAVRVAIGAPLTLALLIFAVSTKTVASPGQNPLLGFAQLSFTIWTVVVLPLHLALIAALVAAVDHESDHWTHLFALPVPRWSMLLGKWLATVGLFLASSVVLLLAVLIGAWLLRIARPDWATSSLPIALVAHRALQVFCAAGLVLSLQLWISLRWRSFIPGLGVGVVGLMVLLGGIVRVGLANAETYLYPWALPPLAMARMAEAHPDRWAVATIGAVGGVLLAAGACWFLARRETL